MYARKASAAVQSSKVIGCRWGTGRPSNKRQIRGTSVSSARVRLGTASYDNPVQTARVVKKQDKFSKIDYNKQNYNYIARPTPGAAHSPFA